MAMPSVRKLLDYWADRPLPGTDIYPVVDRGEPCCWACGWHHICRDYGCAHGLERAHALPRVLGGPEDPSNLALLCRRCHRAAPDTADAGHFWRWIASQKRTGTPLHRAAQLASDIAGLLPESYRAGFAALPPGRAFALVADAISEVLPVAQNGEWSAATWARLVMGIADLDDASRAIDRQETSA